MTKFSESVVGKIKQEHIAPVPRWHFLLKNYVFWSLFGVSVLLGSLAFSVIVEMRGTGDWDMLGQLQGSLFTSAVMLLPYFWMVFLFTFALIAYYNWKHTRIGYHLKRRWIFVGSVASSVFFGSVFYALGWGTKVDELMTRALPIYSESKQSARQEIWQQPEKGLIMGKIVEVSQTGETVIVEDDKGVTWKVNNISGCQKKPKDVEKKGKVIKVIGKKSGEKSFEAQEIRSCGDCGGDDVKGERNDVKDDKKEEPEKNDESEDASREGEGNDNEPDDDKNVANDGD